MGGANTTISVRKLRLNNKMEPERTEFNRFLVRRELLFSTFSHNHSAGLAKKATRSARNASTNHRTVWANSKVPAANTGPKIYPFLRRERTRLAEYMRQQPRRTGVPNLYRQSKLPNQCHTWTKPINIDPETPAATGNLLSRTIIKPAKWGHFLQILILKSNSSCFRKRIK